MEHICGSYPVVYGGKTLGNARIEKLGIRYSIAAETEEPEMEKPFRLAAVCQDRVTPLGVMLPKSGGFVFSKIFSREALLELGIDTISGFTLGGEAVAARAEKEEKETVSEMEEKIEGEPKEEESVPAETAAPADDVWERTDTPWLYIEEGEFRRVFSACREALVRRDGDVTCLAVPILKDELFPVMQVFCLGEVWKINERLHLVFRIREGKLLF